MYSRVEAVAGLMAITHFADVNMYEFLDIVAGASIKTLTERLSVAFDTTKSALSIVYPLDEN